jgi:molecular chaperone HscB
MDSPLFCDHCRSLHPADGLSHFELLGFEPGFELEPAVLRQRYLEISRDVHPDHHGSGSDSAVSLRLSAQLNEAYRVLSDPLLRAEYLLELVGGKSAAQDKNVPQDVLTTALTLREQIADAKVAEDAAALATCQSRVREVYEATMARIVGLARQLPGDEQVRRDLRAALNSMKYYQKLMTEL